MIFYLHFIFYLTKYASLWHFCICEEWFPNQRCLSVGAISYTVQSQLPEGVTERVSDCPACTSSMLRLWCCLDAVIVIKSSSQVLRQVGAALPNYCNFPKIHTLTTTPVLHPGAVWKRWWASNVVEFFFFFSLSTSLSTFSSETHQPLPCWQQRRGCLLSEKRRENRSQNWDQLQKNNWHRYESIDRLSFHLQSMFLDHADSTQGLSKNQEGWFLVWCL